MKSGIRSAQSTPTALRMLRYVRLCAGATPSISVTIRGKAARAAPTTSTVRVDNNLLPWVSVSDAPRDRIDSLSSTLRHRRNMGEFDRRSGIGFMRLATVQRNAEYQQQRPSHNSRQLRTHPPHQVFKCHGG